MPIHDWTKVEAGVFHDFHHAWIEEIKRVLNKQSLPDDYYAMAEQHAGGFGPDVLTLQQLGGGDAEPSSSVPADKPGGGVSLAPPLVRLTAETDLVYYQRKQNRVVVRHVSGDAIVAVVELVSPGNKSGQHALNSLVGKAVEFLDLGVHLLMVDLHPPGPRDPAGVHGAIWQELTGDGYSLPSDQSRTFAAYESDLAIRAYVAHASVGDNTPDVPLFLRPRAHVVVPLEATYQSAFEAFPRRWRNTLE